MIGCAAAALMPTAVIYAAAPLIQQIRERLHDAPVLRGKFEQRKTLRGFRHDLLSGGDFVLARSHGMYWHTAQPFESTLIITPDRILSRHSDGSAAPYLDVKQEPGLRIINELLFALLAADLQTLTTHFHVAGSLNGDGSWRLALNPKDPALTQWLSQVLLEGDKYVREIVLDEASGDRSAIHLTQHSTTARLSAGEAAHFD